MRNGGEGGGRGRKGRRNGGEGGRNKSNGVHSLWNVFTKEKGTTDYNVKIENFHNLLRILKVFKRPQTNRLNNLVLRK